MLKSVFIFVLYVAVFSNTNYLWLVVGFALDALLSAPTHSIETSIRGANESVSPLSECSICFETTSFKQRYTCTTCHSLFCVTCMKSYLKNKVQDGLVSSRYLVCPAADCSHALVENVIESFTDTATFHKYKTWLKNQTIGIRFCPRVDCGAAFEEPLHSKHRRVKCSSCCKESCMRCGGVFHMIPVCRSLQGQHRRWSKQLRKNTRSCPNCQVLIEKNGGCRHMTCTHCHHQFCWKCRHPWMSHQCS